MVGGSALWGEPGGSVQLEILAGRVQVLKAGQAQWTEAGAKDTLAIGDRIRTSNKAKARVTMPDNSTIEVGPSSIFLVDFMEQGEYRFKLNLGTMRAWVKKLLSRRFSVITPTAVCAVRGTEFMVDVDQEGISKVSLLEGLLAVSDLKGNEMTLYPGDAVEVTRDAIKTTDEGQQSSLQQQQDLKALAQREVSADMSKEEVMSAAAEELKLAEYQLGKVMVDVFGKRVRLEEYVFKPQADQMKFVVLNEREERFDYFFYLGTFNQALPNDIGQAILQLGGGLTQPDYYLTAFTSYRSNTMDNMTEAASGGHLVDVGPAGSNEVTEIFDANANKAVTLAVSDHFYKTFFDSYALSLNGVNKIWLDTSGLSISGAGAFQGRIQSLAHEDVSWQYAGGSVSPVVLGPSFYKGDMRYTVRDNFADGTFLSYDIYLIDDQGELLKSSDFAGQTSGGGLKEKMLNWNYQEVITATEFGGRKIDLVVDPKIFIQMGQTNAN